MAKYQFTGTRIYIGPNAPKRGLRYGMGFRDGLTADMAEKCNICPSIFALIVPSDKIIESRDRIQTKGSKFNQAYVKVTEYIKGGGK